MLFPSLALKLDEDGIFMNRPLKILPFHMHLLLVIKIEEDDIEQPENEMEDIEVWVLFFN